MASLFEEAIQRARTGSAQRFWQKVLKTNYCWLWLGGKDRENYGKFWVDGKDRRAHRFAYELFRGPIPKGCEIDHLCLTPACVNPDHLEAVTHRENMARSNCRTRCNRGHPLQGDNVYFVGNNERRCRECERIRSRAYSLRKKNHGLA